MSLRGRLLSDYQRAYNLAIPKLPAGLAGKIDFATRPAFRASLLPLNGQRGRQQIARELARSVEFDEVLETGTFRGASTPFLSSVFGVPVRSCEADARYYEFASRQLEAFSEVSVVHADSRSFLRDQVSRLGPETTVLIYLDAHWHEDLPLLEELEIVLTAWPKAVILVDDFQVPGDAGYGFDDYGPNGRLTLDYIEPVLPADWSVFFPSMPSESESGYRRGCCLLCGPALQWTLHALPSLRVGRSVSGADG